eukprot:gene6594-biopygen8103
MYELEESSADVSLYILAVWWVVPDYVALSVYVPLSNEDLDAFESDLLNMIKHIQFRKTHDQFQDQLREDIKKINASTKAFIPADKTTNYYKLDSELHDKLLTNSITTTYKKANDSAIHTINNEARNIATELNIQDRTECMAERQAFITLKDHKENFQNNPTCRLINPAKSEIGRISKQILDRINTTIRNQTTLNQWKNTSSVINWFNSIPNKHQHTFVIFDIENFYPSITEKLLTDSISFAKKYCKITEKDTNIIMHARKSLLFSKGNTWTKKDSHMFDVTMGSFDGAEICELVGLFILNKLGAKYGKDNIGLYRDDGLAIFKNTPGPQAERIRKDITKLFKTHGLIITIQTNLKIVNYLDVTLNLTNQSYCPYRKPNDQPLYINTKSNHPPNIIKHLPGAINRRITDISCNESEFNKAKPIYENALKASGYPDTLKYNDHTSPTQIHAKNKIIAAKLGIDDRVDSTANKDAFITLKDHKPNFTNKPACRLINPTKSEIGKISKTILDRINHKITNSHKFNQWKNTTSVIEWFKATESKHNNTFISFDVVDFYPSISQELLNRALDFASDYDNITTDEPTTVLKHASWLEAFCCHNYNTSTSMLDYTETTD